MSNTKKTGFWARLRRYSYRALLYRRKITAADHQRFAAAIPPAGRSLVVFSEFDHAAVLDSYDEMPRHLFDTDRYLDYFADYPEEHYDNVICMGLLEHMRDPQALVQRCHAALRPGGRVYVAASSVFSVHRGPENYFHFTPYGARLLFEHLAWTELRIEGSSQPFRTLGILCQRILLQSEIHIVFRPFLELLAWSLPLLDVLVRRQYDGHRFEVDRRIDSMMPSNVWITAQR